MNNKSIILYSSWVAVSLASIAMILAGLQQNPGSASIEELTEIESELKNIAMEISESDPNQDKQTGPKSATITTVMAWLYPGEPACSAVSEAQKYRLDVIKPEYFLVQPGGVLSLLHESEYGCNGYSKANVSKVKQLAPKQIVMVSASSAKDLDAFLIQDARTGEHVRQLVNFVRTEDLSGIELDFENFGAWTPQLYERYKDFITRLGNELHQDGRELMIDLPAVRNGEEEKWYVLRLAEMEKLPVDAIVIMAYDYQYDHGIGEAIAPLDWLDQVIKFTKSRVVDDSKIVIGLPTYAYLGEHSNRNISILTHEQATGYSIYKTAERDPVSKEMMAVGGKRTLVYQDAESISAKVNVVMKNGISQVSFWHLGGNPWFLSGPEDII